MIFHFICITFTTYYIKLLFFRLHYKDTAVYFVDVSAEYILRGELYLAKEYVFDDMIKLLELLNYQQRNNALFLLEAYIKTLK